jgi:hypothetical protein
MGHGGEHHMQLASKHIGQRRGLATIWDMDHVDFGHHLEQLARQMVCRSVAARPHVHLARIDFGVGNKLGDRPRRERWDDCHNEGARDDTCDGCDVAEKTEIEFFS